MTPVINQEYLKTLEDMIIQRIKDSNFDNFVIADVGHKNEQVTGEDNSTRPAAPASPLLICQDVISVHPSIHPSIHQILMHLQIVFHFHFHSVVVLVFN